MSNVQGGSERAVSRRGVIGASLAALAGGWLAGCGSGAARRDEPRWPEGGGGGGDERETLFEISLAEWSLHRELRSGAITNLDFPRVARDRYGIRGVEYVNSFFKDKARDREYLGELKRRCEDAGVRSLLIMCDGEGALGDPSDAARMDAVRNHYRWVEAAVDLGCHAIRVNAQSAGEYGEQQRLAADGLRTLGEFAGGHGIDVIVENHGGLSSNGRWLAETIRLADHPRVGTLPDFGNFCLDWSRSDDPAAWYDRYEGVRQMMPFARAVSAKSHAFDAAGNETGTDYRRMLRIVLEAGYRGWIGVEYEGDGLSEDEGIRATVRLLERVREEMRGEFA